MTDDVPASRRAYDHHLRNMVCEEGTSRLLAPDVVPRATAASWRRRGPRAVVTLEVVTQDGAALQAEVLRLRRRNEMLLAIVRLYVLLVRLADVALDDSRLPEGAVKRKVLAAIARARASLRLVVALRVLGLSPSRYHVWSRPERLCQLDDRSSCPRETPTQLTPDEIRTMRELALSRDHRHLTIRGLALHAQRIGKVFASPGTWGRFIRERGWLRPHSRIHPATPQEGIRATKPNEYWHIDVTVIRLLDGTRLYLHAVIDNFSRRILAWKLAVRLEPQATCAVLSEAAAGADLKTTPATVVADSGLENVNAEVDALLAFGHLRRVLAQVEVTFSNSMIEAWWRSLKHNWLFLNTLDTFAAVERLVAFYVEQHNTVMPHSAFRGQTPDEVYFATGAEIPAKLAAAHRAARVARVGVNRALHCASCPPPRAVAALSEPPVVSNVLQLHAPGSTMS
jgi:putative transposase